MHNNIYSEIRNIYGSVHDIKAEISEELKKRTSILFSHTIDAIVVNLLPFYNMERIEQPYADLESAKLILTNRANSQKALEVDLEKSYRV